MAHGLRPALPSLERPGRAKSVASENDLSSGAGRWRRICLITPTHLAANPRLVKEADALAEGGYDVRVVACQYMDWAMDADRTILERARWRANLVCWKSDMQPYLFWKSRLRQHIYCRLLELLRSDGLSEGDEELALYAYDRVIPELLKQVLNDPADLYIAHNLQALPVAAIAARKHHAKVGFDAEDFHSGMLPFRATPSITERLTEFFENLYLSKCDYITASSPGIAEAYAAKYGISKPLPILNVFPLSHRPQEFRPSKESDPLTLYWFSQTIGPNRGLEDIVQALGVLRNQNIQLHLRGNWQAGYRVQLSELATSVGLNPQQIIAHAPAPPDEMVRLSAQYDVGLALEQRVSENREVCLTNKIFTYLLGGNAVIATATKGQRPVIEAIGAAGFCYEPGDVNRLAGGIKLMHENRLYLQRARRLAWDWGTRKYNWDLEKKKFLRVIETVLTVGAVIPGSNH